MTTEQMNPLPPGWKTLTVGQACRIRNDLRMPIAKSDRALRSGEYPYYGPTGILDYITGYRLDGTFALIGEDGDHFLDYKTKPQTILVSGRFNVNNHAHVIESTSYCDAEWFSNFFQHRNIRRWLTRQGAGRYKLNKDALESLEIIVPPLPEQEQINKALRLWHRAILNIQQLVATKERLKAGFMALLLTGRHRFDGFTTPWKRKALGDLFKERVETNRADLPLLSITREEGVIFRNDANRKDTSSEDKSNYLRICPGDIGYNTMRMWQGVSALSKTEGIVSPAYTICIPSPEIDGKYASYLFKLPEVVNLFYRYSQGLTSDTWNLKFPHFAKIRLLVPTYDEQVMIASFLGMVDTELRLMKAQLRALKEQRLGLMRKLLNGECRLGNPGKGVAV